MGEYKEVPARYCAHKGPRPATHMLCGRNMWLRKGDQLVNCSNKKPISRPARETNLLETPLLTLDAPGVYKNNYLYFIVFQKGRKFPSVDSTI